MSNGRIRGQTTFLGQTFVTPHKKVHKNGIKTSNIEVTTNPAASTARKIQGNGRWTVGEILEGTGKRLQRQISRSNISHIINEFIYFLDVGLDTVNWIKTNPRRSAVYGAIGGFLYTSGKTNPNQNDFNEQIKKCEQLVALVPVDMHNPVTVDYLKNLERNQNLGTLRISSIGLFSIMWINDFAKDLATFDATCEYLKPEWKTFHQRIVDIGFLGNWWNLDRQLRDYDINY